MALNGTIDRILRSGLVSILRAPSGEGLVAVAEALLAGGVEVVEVTFTTPGAAKVIEQMAGRLGDRIVLGAGSILDTETARIAMLAGATFLVTPTVNLPVIEMCRRYGLPVMPGAMTPTEVLTAGKPGPTWSRSFRRKSPARPTSRRSRARYPRFRSCPPGG
jgi:2-dehydro-3-deoxyphosphogluconate aldolase / (4S)-4-hydroxy-2-oxoglutarate aldolase